MIRFTAVIAISFIYVPVVEGQNINYVSNGSFEDTYVIQGSQRAFSWQAMDSAKCFVYILYSAGPPSYNVPNIGLGFQFPRTGINLIASSFYCENNTCPETNARGYPRNKLKQTLKANTAYCAKYFVVNTNNCVIGIDSYGAYFGKEEVDTVKYCSMPITYFTPQIQNPTGNVITDTLHWIPISGTFVATGGEKYMVLGNFKSDAATNTLIINPTFLPSRGTDLYIDDVSLIEYNLPAFAGRDTAIAPGDSVFLGRMPEFGLDELCTWYKLPDASVPIDTIAGFWINPVTTSTYMVRQEICGLVKWDTVTVYMNMVGITDATVREKALRVFPAPASDELLVKVLDGDLFHSFSGFTITNAMGQIVREGSTTLNESTTKIDVSGLVPGVYDIRFVSTRDEVVVKRFVIAR